MTDATATLIGVGAVGYPSPPSYAVDFTKSPTLSDYNITFSRSSTANYFDATGTLQSAASGVPRFDYGPTPGGVTNWIPNSTLQGIVTGTPGTAPTGWDFNGTAGVNTQIVATGTTNGMPYADVRFYGTATVSNTSTRITQLVGNISGSGTWTSSIYLALVAGSFANVTANGLELATFTNTAFTGNQNPPLSITSTLTRFIVTNVTPAGTLYIGTDVNFSCTAGQPVDFTIRVAAPQLENSGNATPWIPTYGTPVNIGAIPLGLLIEEQRTNSVRNPRAEGAAAATTLSPPSAPTLGSTAAGTLAAATYYVTITYLDGAGGETLVSPEASLAVAVNNVLTVTSPAASPNAVSYRVYVSTASGSETLQATVALGTNWTEPTTGLVTGSTPPTTATAKNQGTLPTNWATGTAITTVVLASGTSSWTVPAGVTNLLSVECWGPGGAGWLGGGGGGAYAAISNLAVTPGAAVPLSIGLGGNFVRNGFAPSPANDGTGPTWFNSTTTVSADYGRGNGDGSTYAKCFGVAGSSALSTGSVVYSGGTGAFGEFGGLAGYHVACGGGGGAASKLGNASAGLSNYAEPSGPPVAGNGGNAGPGGGAGGLGNLSFGPTPASDGQPGTSNVEGGGGGAAPSYNDGQVAARGGYAGAGGLPGGGGAGAYQLAAVGADGQIRLTYATPPATNTAGTASFSVIGSGSENGIPYVDMRFFGIATQTTMDILPETTTAIAAAQNQTWTNSVSLRLIAGSFANVGSISLCGVTLDSTPSPLSTYIGSAFLPTTAALASQRFAYAFTITDATTATVRPKIELALTQSAYVDVTIRIGAPQLEQGDFATSIMLPVAGTPAATTRATEAASTPVGSWYNSVAGSLVADWIFEGRTGVYGAPVQFVGTNVNTDFIDVAEMTSGTATAPLWAGNNIQVGGVSVGGATGTDGPMQAGVLQKAVSAWSLGGYDEGALNGTLATPSSATVASLPTIVNLTFAGNMHYQSPPSIWLGRVAYWTRPLTNYEMVQQTSTPAITAQWAAPSGQLTGIGGTSYAGSFTVSGAALANAAAWNINDDSSLSLTNNNLTATNTLGSGVWDTVRSYPSFQSVNKVYAEFTATNVGVSDNAVYIAVMNGAASLSLPGTDTNSFGYNQNGSTRYNGSGSSLAPWTTGDIICLAVDGNSGNIWARVNGGNWNNVGGDNPTSNTGGLPIAGVFANGSVFFATSIHTQGYSITANFSGPFVYPVPTGFTAQPQVSLGTIVGNYGAGIVGQAVSNPNLKPTGVLAALSAGQVIPIVALINGLRGFALAGVFYESLSNLPQGIVATGLANTITDVSATTIYNYEGFDHESSVADLFGGIITALINCSASLSRVDPPYGVGSYLDVTVSSGTSPSTGYAIYNCGPQTISSVTIGVMTQSNILNSISTMVGVANGSVAQVYCQANGANLSFYRGPISSPTLLKTLINVIPATGWFFIEMSVTISPTGSLAAHIDGVQVCNLTNINTSADGTDIIDGIVLGGRIPANHNADFLFDDVYCATGFLGLTRVMTSYPNGNGGQVQFIASGTGANWQQVSEPAMNADSSYNFSSTYGVVDQFTFAKLPSTVASITAAKMTIAARRDASSPISLSSVLVSNQATQYGTITPLANNYRYISSLYTIDPNTGTSWSLNGYNAAQMGYGIVDATLISNRTAASLDFNFITSQTLDPRLTFTRPSTASYFDATGTMQTVAAGDPRFDYGPTPAGVTNWIRNSTQVGAVAPNTFPIYNSTYNNATGASITVVETGYESGIPYIDVAFSGTSNGLSVQGYIFDIGFPAETAQQWTFSTYLRLLLGSFPPNTTLWIEATELNASGTTTASNNNVCTLPTTSPLDTQRFVYTRTNSGGPTTASLTYDIKWTIGAAGAFAFTVRIGGAQAEQNAFASAFVPTSGSPANQGAALLGLLVEEARSNTIRNPRGEGAASGTPGTAPTNWSISNGGATGVSTSVIDTGVEYGIPYIDVAFVGTSSATGTAYPAINFETLSIAALNGQTWAGSIYLRTVSGSAPGITLWLSESNSIGTYLTGHALAGITPTTSRLTTQRVSGAATLNQSSTAYSGLYINFPVASGASVNFTLRIGLPQLEMGNFVSSPILPAVGAPAVTTRADEIINMTNFGSIFQNATAGTIEAEAYWNIVPTGGGHNVWVISDTGGNNVVNLYNQISQQDCYVTVSSNGTQLINGNLGGKPITDGQVFKHALTWNSNGSYTDAANGILGSTITNVALPQNISQLSLGNNFGGGTPLDAYLRRFRYFPRFMQNQELILLTT